MGNSNYALSEEGLRRKIRAEREDRAINMGLGALVGGSTVLPAAAAIMADVPKVHKPKALALLGSLGLLGAAAGAGTVGVGSLLEERMAARELSRVHGGRRYGMLKQSSVQDLGLVLESFLDELSRM